MKHGSLFSGIGGFDLAAEWMGWENIFHCENNSFCQRVLKHYWPDAKSYGDITKTDFSIHRGQIDIVTGGFPCQPFSTAGKRKGKDDNRFLWPEMLRAIREIQPGWVVAENVYGILNQGRGLVFEQVQTQMENEGYEVGSYLLPACAVNAPHRRDRFWFVAHSRNAKSQTREVFKKRQQYDERGIARGEPPSFSGTRAFAGGGLQRQKITEIETMGAEQLSKGGFIANSEHRRFKKQWFAGAFRSSPTVPSIRGRVESGFRGGNDGIPSRVDRLKGLGNAIVPQVAYEIFKAIDQF